MATAMTNSGSRKRSRNGHSKSKDEDHVDNIEDEGPATKKVKLKKIIIIIYSMHLCAFHSYSKWHTWSYTTLL